MKKDTTEEVPLSEEMDREEDIKSKDVEDLEGFDDFTSYYNIDDKLQDKDGEVLELNFE